MYIKADLSDILIRDISRINLELDRTFGSDFISQEIPEAGLGCHPYHITLIGKVHNLFDNLDSVNHYLKKNQSEYGDILISPTNQVKITRRGTVLWFVESDKLKLLGKKILSELDNPRLSDYTTSEYLHITLGMCKNKKLYGQTIQMHSDLFDTLTYYQIKNLGSDY